MTGESDELSCKDQLSLTQQNQQMNNECAGKHEKNLWQLAGYQQFSHQCFNGAQNSGRQRLQNQTPGGYNSIV